MKKGLLTVVVASLVFAFACSSEEGKEDGEKGEKGEKAESGGPLMGTWTIVEAEGTAAETNKGTPYQFEKDKLTIGEGIMSNKADYSLSGDTIIVLFEGLSNPFKYLYSLDGKRLRMELLTSDQVFYLEK
jgi:hypothetical protein